MNDDYNVAGPSVNHPINTKLCNEINCIGFDMNMGTQWIYPNNKPLRSYQHTIIEKCLYKNTLVS